MSSTTMNLASIIQRLGTFPTVVTAVADGVTLEEWRWQPEPGMWSMLEIVGHLAAEEVNDFRPRLRSTLDDPMVPWPGIDPEGEVKAEKFNRADPAEVLARFQRERASSLEWLQSLRAPDWMQVHDHDRLGPIRAGDLLSSWASHDALHLRQLARRRYQFVGRDAGSFAVWYAGPWG
ncbi:MAG: DinB family protein [Planctomycetota bacterium]|jgi:hypothetical protein